MKTRTMYMHTWLGRPAYWKRSEGRIFVACNEAPATLATSLRTIRRQQRADQKSDRERGIQRQGDEWGYVRVAVPIRGTA